MKTKLIIASLFLLTVFTSCSNDSSSSSSSTDYMPLKDSNYWTYDIQGQTAGRDSIYVANDTVINTVTYKKMKTAAVPTGFFCSTLRNNGVKIDGSKLIMTGSAGFDLGLTLPINLSVTDFVFFNEDATQGEQLSSTSGSFSQTIQGYPLTFEYVLKSTADGSLANYTSPNGDAYTDVKKTKVVLNLKITTSVTIPGLPTPISITILAPQDVVISTQYYAKNIGMTYTNTLIQYQLQDLSQFGITLPIPQSGSQTQEEFLDTYVAD